DGISVTVSEGWPDDDSVVRKAATFVFTGDTFPAERLPRSDSVMQRLGTAMNRGAGIVCIHYATGLRDDDVADDGDHPLLHWTGGYFATRCRHHQSIARIWTATIEPGGEEHPVNRGWKPFTLHDEPYINNWFGPNGPAANVTPLAVSMLPPDNPQREIVAWSVERGDGGRGMGVVMPHFFRSWKNEDLRTLILNGIVWTAQVDVPAEGVQTTLPDLARFHPGAVEPKPRK
ncbi:MAG: ThuA domain-containing protein, partial [Maioricimonas sp. JB049]